MKRNEARTEAAKEGFDLDTEFAVGALIKLPRSIRRELHDDFHFDDLALPERRSTSFRISTAMTDPASGQQSKSACVEGMARSPNGSDRMASGSGFPHPRRAWWLGR